jgi:hypothetical protein
MSDNPLKSLIQNYSGQFANTVSTPHAFFTRDPGASPAIAGTGWSKYDKGLVPGVDQNEQRAQLQPWGEQMAIGAGRIVTGVVNELLKMVPQTVGIMGYGMDKLAGGEVNLGEYVNNSVTEFIQNNLKDTYDENVPVYISKAIQEGTLVDNIGSSSFWATEGSDGLAFLLSFLGPGIAMKGAGLIGGAGKLGTIGEGAMMLQGALGRTGLLTKNTALAVNRAKNVESGVVAMVNGFMEASSEAAGGYENILEQLKQKEQQRRDSYFQINGTLEGYDEKPEQILKEEAGRAAAGIFNSNLGILFVPNFIQANILFNTGKKASSAINRAVANRIFTESGKDIVGEIAKLSTRDKVGQIFKSVAGQVLREGFFEEGMQFAAERYFEKAAKGEEEYGFINSLGGIARTYLESLEDVDMQKGIFLGGFLSGPFGIAKGFGEIKQKDRDNRAVLSILRNNASAFSGNIDIYKKEKKEDGTYAFVLDGEGNPSIDPVKLEKAGKTMQNIYEYAAMAQAAELAGDKVNKDVFLKEQASSFAAGYLSDVIEGNKVVLEHVDSIFNLNETPAEDRTMIKNHLVSTVIPAYESSRRYADSLKVSKNLDFDADFIEQKRSDIASTLTALISRREALKQGKDVHAANKTALEMSEDFDNKSPDYVAETTAENSFQSAIESVDAEIKSIKSRPFDELLKDFQEYEQVKQEAMENLMSELKEDKDFEKSNQAAKEDPQREPEQEGEVTTLLEEAKKISEELNKDPKNEQKENKLTRLRDIATRLNELGFISEGLTDAETTYNNRLDKINKFAERLTRTGQEKSNNKKAFSQLDVFKRMFFPKQPDLQKQFDDRIREMTPAQVKKFIKELNVNISVNTIPTNMFVANDYLSIQSAKYSYQVTDAGGEVLGYLPEVNKFIFRPNTEFAGRSLYEVALSGQLTDETLRLYTGNESVTVEGFLDAANKSATLLDFADSTVKPDQPAVVSASEFDILLTPGSYDVVSKDNQNEQVGDIISQNPDKVMYIIDIAKNKESGMYIPVVGPRISGKKDLSQSVANASEAVAKMPIVDITGQAKRSRYVLALERSDSKNQDNTEWDFVYIKTPEADPVVVSRIQKEISDNISKVSEMTDEQRKEFNDSIDERVFVAVDGPNMGTVNVHLGITSEGMFSVRLEGPAFGDKTLYNSVNYESNKSLAFNINKAIDNMRGFPKGIPRPNVNDSMLRKPYFSVLADVRAKDISDYIPSTSSEIRVNKSLEFEYRPKVKKKPVQPATEQPATELSSLISSVGKQSFEKYDVNRPDTLTEEIYNQSQLYAGSDVLLIRKKNVISKQWENVNQTFNENDSTVAPFKIRNSDIPVQSIDKKAVLDRLSKILPSGIPVRFVKNFVDRFPELGEVMGAFMDKTVYLAETTQPGVEYHEAFHGIFRTVLSDNQIVDLLDSARSEFGLPTQSQLNVLKQERGLHSLDNTSLEYIWLEEQVADKFQDYMISRDRNESLTGFKGFVRRIFDAIYDFVKGITGQRSDIDKLFKDIEKGLYVNIKPTNNFFTEDSISQLGTTPMLKLIPYGSIKGQRLVLNSQESLQLTNRVAGYVIKERLKGSDADVKTLATEVLDDFANLYDLSQYDERFGEGTIERLTPEQRIRMGRLYSAVSTELGRNALIDEVNRRIELYELKESYMQDELDLFEDENGPENRKDESFDRSAENKGGFGSLTQLVRMFMGFTVFDSKDEFGNSELKEGVALIEAIDVNKVYNIILRAAANQPSESNFIERLRSVAKDNEQTNAFVSSFFNETGISMEPGKPSVPTKNGLLFQQVVKQLNRYSVDYTFLTVDPEKPSEDSYKVFDANRNDVGRIQVEQWNKLYTQLDKGSVSRNFNTLMNSMSSDSILERIEEDKSMDDIITDYMDLFTAASMPVSKGYVRNLLFNRLKPLDGEKLKTSLGEELYNEYNRSVVAFDDIVFPEPTDFEQFTKLAGISSPFAKSIDESGNAVEDTDAASRAYNIALGNAMFDETVGSSSYQNAENRTVYIHQLPTYHLVKLQELKQPGQLDRLASENPFLAGNMIITDEQTRQSFMQSKLKRLDGLRPEDTNEEGQRNLFRAAKDGVTFKHMTPREFMVSMITTAFKGGKSFTYTDPITGKTEKRKTQTSVIRILETSSTSDMIDLAKSDGYYKDGVSKKLGGIFIKRMFTELYRIQRVRKEIDLINNALENDLKPPVQVIEGYHNKDSKGRIRGLEFDVLAPMLSEETVSELLALEENILPNDVDPVLGKKVREEITAALEQEFNDFLQVLDNEGIINYNSADGTVTNRLTPITDNKYNVKKELGDLFFNDWVNTMAINELLLGDESRGIKDGVDAVKRAKGANASGISAYHDGFEGVLKPFTQLPVSVIKEPLADTKYAKNTQIADAQGYITVEALRNFMYGFGKLTPQMNELIDKLRDGVKLTQDDYFGNVESGKIGNIQLGNQFNSLKIVYYDGERFVKLSAVVLTKELTDNEMFKDLESLRKQMESINDGISMVVPESASKMITADVRDFEKGEELSFNPTDTRFWRLQLEVPSNKKYINDPSQMSNLIDSEIIDPVEQVYFEGEKKTLGEVVNTYRESLAKIRSNNFDQVSRTLFRPDDVEQSMRESIESKQVTPFFADFLKHATETLEASGTDRRTLEFFTPDTTGNYRFNLNFPAVRDKFEELILSYYGKNTFNQKIPGYSVTLMSGFGVKVLEDLNGNIVTKERYESNPNDYVFSDSEEGSGRTALRKRKLAHNKVDRNGIVYSEVLLPAHFKEFMDIREAGNQLPDDVSYMFGVRIPSQDKHSAINLKVIGFLPEFMGSTAIFPDELISLSGADFDIDKLYIHRFEHYVNPDGKIIRYGKLDVPQTVVQPDGSMKTLSEEELKQEKDIIRWEEFKKYKLTTDKVFKKKLSDLTLKKAEELGATLNKEELKEMREYINALKDTHDLMMKSAAGFELAGEMDNHSAKSILFDIVLSRREAKQELSKAQQAVEEGLKATFEFFNLPTNATEYANRGEQLNNAVLQNRILEAKMAMYSSRSLEEARNTPATTDKFKELDNDPELKAIFDKRDVYIVNNMKGKYLGNRNGREGAQNIGPAVNAMLAFNTAAKHGMKLNSKYQESFIEINGFKPTGFDYKNQSEERVNDLISNIITAMTDNAKLLIAAKYGLSLEATSAFSYMISAGYDFKSSILLVNQPLVQEYIQSKRAKKSAVVTKEEEKDASYSYSEALEKSKIRASGKLVSQGKISNLTDQVMKDDLVAFDNNDVLNQELQEEALRMYIKFENFSQDFTNLSKIIKLTKGIESNFEVVDDILNAVDKFKASEFHTNKSGILNNPYIKNNIDVLQTMNESMKKIMIDRKGDVSIILNSIIESTSSPEFIKEKDKKSIRKSIMSNLMLRAYRGVLERSRTQPGFNPLSVDLLNHDLLFDKDKNITVKYKEVLKYLKEVSDEREYSVKNAFVDYVFPQNRKKSKPYWTLEANTRVKEDPVFTDQIIDGYEALFNSDYANETTREFAIAALNYTLIKDGGMYKNRSFINFIPPIYFSRIAARSMNVPSALELMNTMMEDEAMTYKERKNSGYGKDFMNIFGEEFYALRDQIMVDYFTHPANSYRLINANQKSVGKFGPSSPELGIFTVDDASTITFDLSKVNEIKPGVSGLYDFAGIKEVRDKEDKIKNFDFKFGIKYKGNVYIIQDIDGKRYNMTNDGKIPGKKATYKLVPQQGVEGVEPGGNQPLTSDFREMNVGAEVKVETVPVQQPTQPAATQPTIEQSNEVGYQTNFESVYMILKGLLMKDGVTGTDLFNKPTQMIQNALKKSGKTKEQFFTETPDNTVKNMVEFVKCNG